MKMLRHTVLLPLALAALAGCQDRELPTSALTEAPPAFSQGASGSGPFAYVANYGSNTVSVINMSTNMVERTVDVGSIPWDVAFTPDGTLAYVANAGSNTVSVIHTGTHQVVTSIDVGEYPNGVAFTPDGRHAYVTNRYSHTVSVINTTTNTVLTSIAVGDYPDGVAITPDGTRAYVVNFSSNTVSVINTSTNAVFATIGMAAGAGVQRVAITPDGEYAYVTAANHNGVRVIDIESNMVVGTIGVGSKPNGVEFTPDGKRAYVTNFSIGGPVSVIDTETRAVGSISGFSLALDVATTPDGGYVYVTNFGSSTVSVINTSTNTVEQTIDVGTNPAGIAVMPAPPTPSTDNTPPLITPNVTGTLGQDGWYTSDVTVRWSVVDPESNITSPACAPTTISSDTSGQDVACNATSAGGISNESVTITRDATPPVVIETEIVDGGAYTDGNQPEPICSTTDAVSGVATAATYSLSGAGTVTVTCSGAVDNAGNTTPPVTKTITVLYQLFVMVNNTDGSGTVNVSPQKNFYSHGDVVTLTAVPANGSIFSAWLWDLAGTTNPATFVMDGSKSAMAVFTAARGSTTQTLTVTVTGPGMVSSTTGGIACTEDTSPCSANFSKNTKVELSTSRFNGATFTGWSGDLSGTKDPIELTMNGDKSVAASFAAPSALMLSIDANGIIDKQSGTAFINGSITCSTPTANLSVSVVVTQVQGRGRNATTVSGSGTTQTFFCDGTVNLGFGVTPSSPAGSKFAAGAVTVTATAPGASPVTRTVQLK